MSVISAHQTLNIKQFSILPSSTSISHSSSMFSPISCFSSSTNSLSTKFFQEKRSSSVVRVSSSSSSTVGFSESISEILGDFTAAGESVMIKDLWDQDEGVAVVALLRHFGCPCCWELASTLKESKSRFDSAGVKLIAVGVGTPDKARILAERLPFPMDSLYADPDRKASVFSRSEALRKAVKNYTIKATPDDRSSVLQQGGIFVFKGKQLLYARKDEGTGDHAPLEEIFNICCSPVA